MCYLNLCLAILHISYNICIHSVGSMNLISMSNAFILSLSFSKYSPDIINKIYNVISCNIYLENVYYSQIQIQQFRIYDSNILE